jgi:MFS family permease
VRNRTTILILGAAQFIMVLDTTVMNVSISEVVKDLDTTVSQVQLAITAYALVMAAFMLTGAKLGNVVMSSVGESNISHDRRRPAGRPNHWTPRARPGGLLRATRGPEADRGRNRAGRADGLASHGRSKRREGLMRWVPA